jgi:hypothetical protein
MSAEPPVLLRKQQSEQREMREHRGGKGRAQLRSEEAHALAALIPFAATLGGETKVANLHVAFARNEDVRRFQIAMDDALVVDVVEALENLAKDAPALVFVLNQGACLDELVERVALAKLHLYVQAQFVPRATLFFGDGKLISTQKNESMKWRWKRASRNIPPCKEKSRCAG